MTPLGFVGLGRMGSPMAARLLAAGHPLIGYDAAGPAARPPAGASHATTLAELAAQAEVVCLSLPDGAASHAVCTQLAAAPARRVQIVVELSTVGMAAARACAELLAAHDIAYLDAPVSGGVAGARAGSLAIMVSGAARHVAAVEPLLAALGAHRFHVGAEPGQGQAMKLLNNYVSGAALAATSEAAVFGARVGLDLAQLVAVLNVSSGRTTASSEKFPRSVIPRSYDFGFAGALMAKDIQLYLESAVATESPHSAAEAIAALWRRYSAACPGTDFTAIHHFLEEGGS